MAAAAEEEGRWLLNRVPDDIAERIASKLTAYDILRLSCTCRRFRSLTFSSSESSSTPNLLLLPADDPSLPSEDPHRLSFSRSFDPDSLRWIHLPLSFLRPHLPPFSHPIASSGGLLSFGSGRSFLVCNPLIRSWKKLPDIPLDLPSRSSDGGESFRVRFDEDSVQAFGLSCDRRRRAYEFVTIICAWKGDGMGCKAAVYSSSLGKWMGMSEINMEKGTVLLSASLVMCETGWYSLWQKHSDVVVYRMDGHGNWDEIEFPDCSSPLQNVHLVKNRKMLHILAGVGSVWVRENMVESPTSIRIWQLHHESQKWSEVARFPSALIRQIHQLVDFHTSRCWSSEGVIYMTNQSRYMRSRHILMYDLNSGNWTWLQDEDLDDEELTGHVLEPSLMPADTPSC